jgi:NADPH-dependent 2,4-dienoyl-CoA reductase/sulfur reductase-like enzyme
MKRSKKDKQSFSRRDFLKTTAVGAAVLTGLGSAKRTQAQVRPGMNWDKETDVVVVGSGATGLPAAIEAIEGGASVIVVEANWDVGGHAELLAAEM